MRFLHPLVHHLRRLFRLPDSYRFYENDEGTVDAGCSLCEEFLAKLLVTDEIID